MSMKTVSISVDEMKYIRKSTVLENVNFPYFFS